MRRFGVVIPLIFVGLVLGFTLTNSEANAHVPSDIYLNEITQSSIKIIPNSSQILQIASISAI